MQRHRFDGARWEPSSRLRSVDEVEEEATGCDLEGGLGAASIMWVEGGKSNMDGNAEASSERDW